MTRGSRQRSPAPRAGLNAARLPLPADPASAARFRTAVEYLAHRFPDDAPDLAGKLAAGDVVDGWGRTVTPSTPYEPGGFLFVFRPPPVEPAAPDPIPVLHRDADLLVVDKPHFLATTPRGAYVTRSVVVRLRRELDLPDLSPAHRLDRLTAGVLLLTVRPAVRGAYQAMFERRGMRKVYEAVAPYDPARPLPVTRRSRIEKRAGHLRAAEVAGEPNAETRIDLMAADERQGLGGYRLEPRTGRTHQLRLHLASLGLPIRHDVLYGDLAGPVPADLGPDDAERPLQLLARSIEFDDPLTGRPRRFVSRRDLTEWPAADAGPAPGQ